MTDVGSVFTLTPDHLFATVEDRIYEPQFICWAKHISKDNLFEIWSI
jgi:hypothetical protein